MKSKVLLEWLHWCFCRHLTRRRSYPGIVLLMLMLIVFMYEFIDIKRISVHSSIRERKNDILPKNKIRRETTEDASNFALRSFDEKDGLNADKNHFGNLIFSCRNIPSIKLKKKLGQGVTKQGYLGEYNGTFVVVKMGLETNREVSQCLEELKIHGVTKLLPFVSCKSYPNMKLIKEILLLHELNHRNIAHLLGYCVKSDDLQEKLEKHGVVSVFEYGTPLSDKTLHDMSWKEKIRHAEELISLLAYLAKSPLGSLRIDDFKLTHFVLVGDSIKYIDLDAFVDTEQYCEPGKNQCFFDLPCIDMQCPGVNSRINIKYMWNIVLKYLLSPVYMFPISIRENITEISQKLIIPTIDAETALAVFIKIRKGV